MAGNHHQSEGGGIQCGNDKCSRQDYVPIVGIQRPGVHSPAGKGGPPKALERSEEADQEKNNETRIRGLHGDLRLTKEVLSIPGCTREDVLVADHQRSDALVQ